MAYREIGMWEIIDVLRRVAPGERQRSIARVDLPQVLIPVPILLPAQFSAQ
jgi:hypothetical protein